MGLSDFYPPTTAIGDLRSDINELKHLQWQKADKHEISTLTNDVACLARSIGELSAVVNGLLTRLQEVEARLSNIYDTPEAKP